MQVAFVGRPKHMEQACAVFLELLRQDRVTGRRVSPGHKYDSFTMRAALPGELDPSVGLGRRSLAAWCVWYGGPTAMVLLIRL
jgi:hypothetical protein